MAAGNYIQDIIDKIRKIICKSNKLLDEKEDHIIRKVVMYLSLPGSVMNLLSEIKKYEIIRNCFEIINELKNNIETCPTDSADSNLKLIDKIDISSIKGKCRSICAPLLSTDDVCNADIKKIIKELDNVKRTYGNDIIRKSAMASSILIMVQIVKLVFVWKDISDAKNVIEDSKRAFPEIENNIAKLKEGIAKLVKYMQDYEQIISSDEKLTLARKVDRLTRSLNSTYVDTKDLISDVKIKLGSKIERIDLRKDEQIVDGITNVLHGVSNVVQFVSLGGVVGTGYKVLQGTVTTLFFGLAAANATAYTITKSTLKTLRESMQVVKNFEIELKELRKAIEEAEKWIDDNIP